ncbi:MAG TPA: efflux RND transporter periplasmic adaptor subunit [Burkholderiaceae bacterium]|nr:efflux RND transporter periplasmic adaptor subunit [Burkholderiaceae bacterium]
MAKSRSVLLATACVLLITAVWLVLERQRGPELPAYQVTSAPLVQTVVATGRVAALSRAQVGSEVTGVVVERRVKEGDRVQAGDILAILRATELEAAVNQARAELARLQESTLPQAQAAVREAEVALAQASREAQRRRQLYEQRAIPREELERAVQAEAAARASAEQANLEARSLAAGNPNEALARARLASAEAQLAKTIIRAQVSGTVLTRNAEPGDLVQPSRVLFEIAHDGDIEVLVPLDEKNLEVLELGQKAICIADAYPGHPFPAIVNFIAPSVDPQRGTVDVRLSVTDDPGFLREDMTVSVNIETGRRDQAVVLPNDALSNPRPGLATVWVVEGGKARQRSVELGLRGLAATEIVSGLRAGETVLADTPATLKEGDRVRIRSGEIPSGSAGRTADSASRNELPVRFN